ncbi:hypothetical protein GQ457_14G020920 [Hibiscus cannabinus]
MKKTLGRHKVEMVKMTNETHLLATFSKRRVGLFKKASELSTLSAAEVVIVVFSPGKKVYSFKHHSAEVVIACFLGHERPKTSEIEAHCSANMIDLQILCMHMVLCMSDLYQLTSQLDDGKKHGDELREANKAIQDQNWRIGPFEELERPQLLQLRSATAKLKNDMDLEMATILDASSSSFTWGALQTKGTNINPAEERMAIHAEEYIVNPAERNNINHAEGDNVILPRNDIPDAAPGFGGPYNIINPEVIDILDVAGFGEYTTNPPRNNNLDSLDTVLKGFDGFFYS